MIRGRTRNPTPPQPWIPAFAGKTVEPRRARASGYPEGGGGVSGPLTRPRDGFLLSQEWLRSGAGRGPAPIDHPCESRGLPPLLRGASYSPPPRPWIPAFAGMVAVRWSVGASHASPGWIPAFAGKTVEPRRARASGYPEGGGGASGPLTRPRDGFLLSQERRWNHVVPAQAGTQRGEVERRGLSRATALDSCFRRNGCEWPTLTLPGQASLALHGRAGRAAPAGTSADCAVSRKPCPPADPLRCVSGSWGSPSATGRSGRTRR